MAKKKQTAAEKISELTIEDLNTLTGAEGIATLKRYVNILKQGVLRRNRQFSDAGEFSYAFDALKRMKPSWLSGGEIAKNASKGGVGMRRVRGKLISDIVKYQQFFKDETSTMEGIKEVNRRQDIRIFGEVMDEEGKATGIPVATMTRAEREEFWSVYMDYASSKEYAADVVGYMASSSVQTILQDVMASNKKMDKTAIMAKVHDLYTKAEEQRKLAEAAKGKESVANVYSGHRRNNKK